MGKTDHGADGNIGAFQNLGGHSYRVGFDDHGGHSVLLSHLTSPGHILIGERGVKQRVVNHFRNRWSAIFHGPGVRTTLDLWSTKRVASCMDVKVIGLRILSVV